MLGSPIQDFTDQPSSQFIRLLDAAIINSTEATHWVIAKERYPVIDGIPILLKNHCTYLRQLGGFLETQIEKLHQFCGYPPDKFWAEPQIVELHKRLRAVRSVLGEFYPIESQRQTDDAFLPSKYDSEANTDIYTRIAWGYRSCSKEETKKTFPDAGDLYTCLATLIRFQLPKDGIFLDLGCGVGRAVFEAALFAPDGLAIGLDLSLSKILRARAIVRGRSVTRYPVREQEGMVEVEVRGQGLLNTSFGVGDGTHLLLPEGSVDCALLGLMIGLVPDPQELLREVVRVLKPAGSMIIVDPFDAFYDYDYPWDHRLTTTSVINTLMQVVPEATVEMIGPVAYEEHWAHSKTVTYNTIFVTVKKQAKPGGG